MKKPTIAINNPIPNSTKITSTLSLIVGALGGILIFISTSELLKLS